MATNAIGLALAPFFVAMTLLGLAIGYHALELVLVFWTLGLASYGVGRIMAMAVPRAFCAVFLALVFQLLFVFGLHLLGLIPKDVLKALMTV